MATDFWDNAAEAASINQKIIRLEEEFKNAERVEKHMEEAHVMLELLSLNSEDKEMGKELDEEIAIIKGDLEALEINTLFSEAYDDNNVVMALHAGAGGVDAQDWVEYLYKMYLRWSEKNGYKVSVLDYLDGDEAGIKSVTIHIEGPYAYGHLKSEQGVHRLVRISPFDTNKKRHTSFASVEVLPETSEEDAIEIRDEDIRIDTYRSGGAGGQHVNKTDSAVRITHLPTGIVAQCQSERSQLNNRNSAMKILRSKLLEKKRQDEEAALRALRGEHKEIGWGSQIRSYVFQPYQLVKDHRTNYESGQVESVLNGDLDGFIKAYLRQFTGR